MLQSFWSLLFAIWKHTALCLVQWSFWRDSRFLCLAASQAWIIHSFMISVSRIKNIINLNRLTFELPCANFTALLLVGLKNWMLHTIHDFGCVNILWEKSQMQRHQLGNDRKNHETIYFWYENKLHFKRNMEKINWHHFACMVENVFHLKLKREDNFLAMEFSIYIQHFQTLHHSYRLLSEVFFLFIFSKSVHVFNEWI